MSAATVPFDVVFAHALQGETCTVRTPDGRSVPLPVEDWTRGADLVDRLFLRHCSGATIDVGCGPGRHAHALARRGISVHGVDISARFVEIAAAGAPPGATFARADARYMRARPDIKVGGEKIGEAKMDPWTVGFGIGARF